MSTVLAYTTPAIGHLYPMMAVLLELHERGHDVHVRTLERAIPDVMASGLSAQPIDPLIEPILNKHPDWEARNAKEALQISVSVFTERAPLDAADLQRAIAEVRPDVLFVDGNAWGAVATAEASGIPWASCFPFVLPIPSQGVPPFGPGLRRRTDIRGRIRDAIVGKLVFQAVEKAVVPQLNEIRTECGLTPIADASDSFTRADRIIVGTSQPFDYPHPDWPAKIREVGLLSWEPPTTAPDWLAESDEPITLVTTSSEYQADESLAKAAIEGLADHHNSVVITMPAGVPDDLGPLPDNVRVEQFIAHGHVLPRATVAVTHGGMGATQKALAAGVPVCVVPFGRDQAETAARVVHAQAGTALTKRKLTPSSLSEAIRKAATKSDGARRCRDGFIASGGAAAAASAIEELT